jgi:hypothetical protein
MLLPAATGGGGALDELVVAGRALGADQDVVLLLEQRAHQLRDPDRRHLELVLARELLEVELERLRGRIAILGRLGERLHHDLLERGRVARHAARRQRDRCLDDLLEQRVVARPAEQL